ncbi:hypothetical protein [uncultured Bradyrhizobium sp.]|uniref:hypothetical protein n=1 Tax=uncultured Bradyrhizobium sp. TaxID=199684 RepID=UPI0026067596|nr:hypothetical protein [uncultured Bradyrhizobium sp.]
MQPSARAADYCSGDAARPLALSPDKRVLCLDGVITSELNLAVATDLADRGFAVVRSSGGDQHYPDSQEEVDKITIRLGLNRRVIYDP